MPPLRKTIAPKGPSKVSQQPSPGTQQHAPGSIFAPKTSTAKNAGNPNVPGHQGNANSGNGGGNGK